MLAASLSVSVSQASAKQQLPEKAAPVGHPGVLHPGFQGVRGKVNFG